MKPEITEGFDQRLATSRNPALRKVAQEQFKAQVKILQEQLRKALEQIEEEQPQKPLNREPHPAQSFTPVVFSRRVLLSTDQQLKVNDILTLNKIYQVEQEFLEKTQQVTMEALLQNGSEGYDQGAFTGKERVEILSAVHQAVRSATDSFTKSNDLTSFSTEPDAPETELSEEHELLLEDFFKIAQEPNEAEFIMLDTALSVDIDELVEWFEEKQQKASRLFGAMELALNKDKVSKALRKQH